MAMQRSAILLSITIQCLFHTIVSKPTDTLFDENDSSITRKTRTEENVDLDLGDMIQPLHVGEELKTIEEDDSISGTRFGLGARTSNSGQSGRPENQVTNDFNNLFDTMSSALRRRQKRAVRYRGRCCYVDVMCSRGCRRPSVRGRRRVVKRRSALSDSTLKTRQNFDYVFKTKRTSERLQNKLGSSIYDFSNRIGAPLYSTMPSKTVLDPEKVISKILAQDGGMNLLHKLLQIKGENNQLSSRQYEIVKGLPIILDELEYLTQKEESR